MFKKKMFSLCVSTLLTSSFCLSAIAAVKQEVREPEAATGVYSKALTTAEKFMVVAANPHASEAGYNVLKEGGSAIDAAIAVQATLTLVEPQSSGIGGGAFILYWDNTAKKLYTIDARETAPAAATPELFLDEQGKAAPWIEAVVGGRSVGVPGVLAGLALAHKKWGKAQWSTLFSHATSLASDGFEVSPRLALLIAKRFNPGVHQMPDSSAYFFPEGQPLQAGTKLKNPELAESLNAIALKGVDEFYQGTIAKSIVNKVQNSPIAPGTLTLDDMKNYQPVMREALCDSYRQYQLCGMGPPSSGGITVLQIAKLIEQYDFTNMEVNSQSAIHLMSQASRLAFADRNHYVADPDFTRIPTRELLDNIYINNRRSLISTHKDMGKAPVGDITGLKVAKNDAYELPNTSHFSIVDAKGNAVSMTSSIEMAFGSTVMAGGFLLNNQLTDFALSPSKEGKPVLNRVEANKRPRSSMAPFMVFDDTGNLKLILGAPGGSRIINYVMQTLVAYLDWKLDIQQAINLPKFTHRNDYLALEEGTALAEDKTHFERMGYQVKVIGLNSGLHAIGIENGKLYGGADPRREGIALGD